MRKVRVYVSGAYAKPIYNTTNTARIWLIKSCYAGENFSKRWPLWPSLVETYILHSMHWYLNK